MQLPLHFGDSSPGLAAPELAEHPLGLASLVALGCAPPGLSQKDEDPELGRRGVFSAQGDAQEHSHCDRAGPDRKAWATVQARCALAGFTPHLIEGDDGRPLLVVSRWALTRSFTSPSDAESWLRRVL